MKQKILLETFLKKIGKRMPVQQLTEREICCLLLAANGMTTGQTAELLGIRPSTVETHRKGIKKKLASNSMAQAVYQGIKYGYMDIQLIKAL
jgi:DNA-binding CsgD family transcriptional regulator